MTFPAPQSGRGLSRDCADQADVDDSDGSMVNSLWDVKGTATFDSQGVETSRCRNEVEDLKRASSGVY